MQLGVERRSRIRQRLEPILKQFHPDLQFVTVFVDSQREDLGIVAQLGERPILMKFRWIDFISMSEEVLQEEVFAQLRAKLGKEPAAAGSGDGFPPATPR
jgi:hypothetical protein